MIVNEVVLSRGSLANFCPAFFRASRMSFTRWHQALRSGPFADAALRDAKTFRNIGEGVVPLGDLADSVFLNLRTKFWYVYRLLFCSKYRSELYTGSGNPLKDYNL